MRENPKMWPTKELDEKDAEIARLKKLITELCDALNPCLYISIQEVNKLLQRAREATR
jgi:hypothetical protein